MLANCPVLEALGVVRSQFPDRPLELLVSLGAGSVSFHTSSPSTRKHTNDFFSQLLQRKVSSVATSSSQQQRKKVGLSYWPLITTPTTSLVVIRRSVLPPTETLGESRASDGAESSGAGESTASECATAPSAKRRAEIMGRGVGWVYSMINLQVIL